MKKTRFNTTRQINKAYHSHMKSLVKGEHERDIFESLSAGKNSYLRLDRLESSSFDKSWIEVIEGVIFDLGEIIANPRMHTKTEGVLTPVELAKKTNGESVQHLASHTQYVKEVDEYGNVIPSKLLSITSDDDLHTYENRFIATFVRRLVLFIEKRYEFVSQFAELRNEEILYFKNKSVVDGANVEIETKVKISYKNDDNEAIQSSNYIQRIAETRRYILYFYNSPFMKAMKNERDVRNPVVQTNIIRKNPKYHHCFEVYRFIETYDRLGVSYKVDENYSLFSNEELQELNRTLMANYLTVKGKEMSRKRKTNSKVYKPKILTSLDDESFVYGPLLEGPISFVRVDEGYQNYLDSKIKKDLPLHPTKKEKEYYADEYADKAENKQDLKAKNDLMKRKQKEVSEFERKVKKILEKREEAMQKLLELEKEAIKQEEFDMLEEARRAIIAASQADMQEQLPKEEPVVEETPVEEPISEPEPQKVYVPTVTFEEAADEIWPQLKHPHPLKQEKQKNVKKEQAASVEQPVEVVPIESAPVSEPAPKKEYVPTVSFDDVANEIWPQLNNPNPLPKEEAPVAKKAKPVKKAKPAPQPVEEKPVEKVYVPTVSFEEAADEIWPQLKNPQPLPKEEAPVEVKPIVKKVKPSKKVAPKQAPTPVYEKPAERVYTPTISFDDAADEIWPQLKNPHPLPKQEQEPVVAPAPRKVSKKKTVKKKPVPVEPINEQPIRREEPVYTPTVTFDDAADEIWPQLKNPTPLVKEEPAKEEQPAPVKKAAPKKKAQPKKKPAKKAEKAPVKEEKKPEPKPEPKKEPAPKKVKKPAKPKEKAPEPQPKVLERKKIPGRFIVKTLRGYYVGTNKYSIAKEDAFVFDDFNLASDIKKEKGGKIVKL